MNLELADIGAFLGSLFLNGLNGFRKESVKLQITGDKEIILKGKAKFIFSSLFALIFGGLFLSIVWILLVIAGII